MAKTIGLTGLDELRNVLRDFRALTSWQVHGTLVLPLTDFITKVGPPWPPYSPLWTMLVETLVLIVLFHYNYKANKKELRRIFHRSLIFTCVFAFLFLIGSSKFILESKGGSRDLKGFILREEVKVVISPVFTEDKALEGAEWDPTKVWTIWSITFVRVGLFVTWLCFFGGLTR